MNLQSLMTQAKQMQREITNAQKEISEKEIIGKSGLVTIKMMGDKTIKEVKIEKDSDLTDDLTILEDMIVLALNDAHKQIEKITEEKMGKYSNILPGIF